MDLQRMNFKEEFNKKFKSIYDFMDAWEYEKERIPWKMELVQESDDPQYDSYGSEDTDLAKIFYVKDFDVYVKFVGNRSSYQGTEWYSLNEVTPKTKTIKYYE